MKKILLVLLLIALALPACVAREVGSILPESDQTPAATIPGPETPPPTPFAATAVAERATAESTLLPTPVASPTVLAMQAALPGTIQNFELVGRAALKGVGGHAGLALHQQCAYLGNRNGFVSILDVSDPANPVGVGRVDFGRSVGEVAEVRIVPERNLLVVADLTRAPHLYTFDVSNCRTPQPIAAATLAVAPHEFFLWQGGGRLLFFGATFGGPPDLVVIDLTDAAAPVEVASWSLAELGVSGELHSVTVLADGRRALLPLWRGGFVVAEVALPALTLHLEDDTGVAPFFFPNTHSAVPLRDPHRVLLTSEIYGCPFGDAIIVDIANPADPRPLARLTLPENRCETLPPDQPVYSAHNPLVVGDLVFLSWYSAGLQAVDVRDPGAPVRVGQYVPDPEGGVGVSYVGPHPVQIWSFPIIRAGLIYVADIQSGLHVVRYTGPGAAAVEGTVRAEGNVIVAGDGP